MAGDTDGGTAVGDTVGELVDGGGLVLASQAALVALTVDLDVLGVLGLELLAGGDDVLDATLLAHVLGGEVGVAAGAVPVSGDGLGVNGDDDAKVLGDLVEDEAGHPEVVANVNAAAGADLELPLGGEHLSVGAADLDASVEAGLVVGLNNVAAKDTVSAHTAVVGTLGGGETIVGPAKGTAIDGEEGVLLLDAEPGLKGLDLLKDDVGVAPGVAGWGVPSLLRVSHMTRMLSPPRKGSLKMATGLMRTSELSPGAWPVEDPSKFQMRSSSMALGGASRVMVLLRRLVPVPSIQT